MKITLGCISALALSLASVAVGQTVEEFPLRPPLPANSPPSIEEVVFRHTDYDDRGLNRAIQKVAVPTLTVYRPAKSDPRGVALVVCPGGAYRHLAIDKEGHAMGRFFAERGITVAVLKYRLPDPEVTREGRPLSLEDGLAAVQFVRARAKAWGINPQRVGILGASAGGHLAGSVGIFGDAVAGSRPDFVGMLYPVACLEGPHAHAGLRTRLLGPSPSPSLVKEHSLDQQARAGLPPFFLAHARDDRGVPYQNSEVMAAALKAKGVPAQVLILESGGHGFGLGRDAETQRWVPAFLSWVEKLP